MKKLLQVALYARVSSDRQVEAGTIESQVTLLKERIKADGHEIHPELCFIDEGFSGATLVRPSLEKLRDIAYLGNIDKLYILSADRLARKYVYQVLLVEEFQKYGTEIIFLQHEHAQTPEGDLLLQMQGMIAEYERAKIIERSRRGKLHKARKGSVNVLSGAPYGYRYITAKDNGGEAQYILDLNEAKIVRQIFDWMGTQRISIGEIKRRLEKMNVPTKTGRYIWDRSAIWGILKNPAYIGKAAFGKTKIGKRRPALRPVRGGTNPPKRFYSVYQVPNTKWIYISVPPIISIDIFQTVQEQLEENRKRSRVRKRGARYLLQGLLVCKKCGYSYYGKPVSLKAQKGKQRNYAYYRCIGSDAYRFGGQRICSNKQVRTDYLEKAVWNDICEFLTDPDRIEEEYKRRLSGKKNKDKWQSENKLRKELKRINRGINKLIDAYTDELISKDEFSTRIGKLRKNHDNITNELNTIERAENEKKSLYLIIGRMKEFAQKIADNINNVNWEKKRGIIRSIVKCIEINETEVHIIYRVNPVPFQQAPEKGHMQYCLRGHYSPLGCTFIRMHYLIIIQYTSF
jgi:site-specific DNA recombinase